MIYAVIDTNVLVSALITKNPEAATAKVVRLLLDNGFVLLYDADIIAEYEDVLHRSKFPILPGVADASIWHWQLWAIYPSTLSSERYWASSWCSVSWRSTCFRKVIATDW